MIKEVGAKYVGFVACVMLIVCGCNQADKLHHDLPVLYITAPDADTLFVKCRQKIDAYAVLVDEKGDTLIDEQLRYIKSRGNSTFADKEKKPFAIKFERNIDILGLYKSKKFVLLANAFDESHIRTAIAFDLAHRIGVPAPRYAYVVLYINEKYQGLYQITNAVEINKHSLNITDLEKENKYVNSQSTSQYPPFKDSVKGLFIKGRDLEFSPDDISGGYLLGMVPFERKESGFRACSGDWIVIEEPKYASREEVKYIQSYVNQLEEMLADTISETYSNYLDIGSFARYYLLQEILLNQDFCWVSVYMYKDAGESAKLCAGPIWDTDISLGTLCWAGRVMSPNMMWAQLALGKQYNASSEGMFYRIYRHPSFRDSVRQIYLSEVSPIIHAYIEEKSAEQLSNKLRDEIDLDYWNNGNRMNLSKEEALISPIQFLQQRVKFMDWYFSTSRDSMVCLRDLSETKVFHHDRRVCMYFPKGKAFIMPEPLNHKGRGRDPIPEWYVCGTDKKLSEDVIMHSDCDIEIRERNPLWWEIRKKQYYTMLSYLQVKSQRMVKLCKRF